MRSAIYEGWVRHRRSEPVENHFRYALAMVYLDLDELPTLFAREPLWSLGRPNLAWFQRSDYLGDPALPLDEAVRGVVAEHGGERPTGPIRMLTQVRTLGFLFNPVTFYYCYDEADTRVEAIVTEITNTPWMERCVYVLRRDEGEVAGRRHRFRFPKSFHVSPFMPMEMDYDWRFTEPGERLHVHMDTRKGGRTVLDATLVLERRPLTKHTFTRAVLRRPLITLKVVAAIYVQALRLWWKRCPFIPHPRRAPQREEGISDVATCTEGHRSQHAEPHAHRPAPARTQPRARPPAPDHRRRALHS